MDTTARSFLDRLLTDGRALARQAEDTAAERLGVGPEAAARRDLRQAGLAGAGALGLAALLLGRRRRAGLAQGALLLGGIGALARIAMEAWARTGASPDPRAAALEDDGAEARARTLLFAMVAAAKADGHIDEEEHSAIEAELDDLPLSVRGLLGEAIAAPSDPEAVAARVGGGQEAREVYAASALLCGRDHPEEEDYLNRLALALGLSPEEARRIEGDVLAAV
jgi:uncharacterized membrane protein YebE (DUF533 family)